MDEDAMTPVALPIDGVSDVQLAEAEYRLRVIQPILDDPDNTEKHVQEAIETYGLSRATIYKWKSKYQSSGRLTSLVSKRRRKRKTRLDRRVEQIIKDAVQDEYLIPKQPSMLSVIENIRSYCKKAKLKAPHDNTIRKRINEICDAVKTRRRRGRKAARNQHEPVRGRYNEGIYPLQMVQVDTQVQDLQLLDDIDRSPIGGPYVTAAIDVFRKVIIGVYVSLIAPSAFTAGQCIRRSMLPKEKLLADYGIQTAWDVHGRPVTIHMDNGTDFRSESLRRSCQQHGISIEFRPPDFPNWGGVIERFFNTLASHVQDMDGTTKSNPIKKGEYNSEENAIYTMSAFEAWLYDWITSHYHLHIHSDLGVAPIDRWRDGIEGRNGFFGIGKREPIEDTHELFLDFLPSALRTIDRRGIRWDNIYYYADDLDHWIGKKDGNKSIKHIVRRDPNNLSEIFFYDPERKRHVRIPYRNLNHPAITLWELKDARKAVAKNSSDRRRDYETEIMAYIERRKEREQLSRQEKVATKTARRKKQRAIDQKRRAKASPQQPETPAHTNVIHIDRNKFRVNDSAEKFDFSDEDLSIDTGEW